MIRAQLSRDDLGSYLSKPNLAGLDRTLASSPKQNQVVLEFPDDGIVFGGLPHRIIVPDNELEQFYAWMATYFDALSPITSFIDVVPASEEASKNSITLSEERLRVLITITVVEASIQVRLSKARQGPGMLAASLRCASWIYAQCLSRGRASDDIGVALDRWVRVRGALTGVDTPYRFEYVTTFWNEILPLFGVRNKGKVNEALVRLNKVALETGQIDLEFWANLSPALKPSKQAQDILRGPRQERVELFTEATRSLPNDDEDKEMFAAFCGYLASRVSDGGLELWNVVLDRSSRFPTMPLWFAFYCAVRNGQDLMTFEHGVPFRLIREFDKDSFDIDAREFMILNRGRGINASDIHVPNPGSLRVRVSPNITGEFLVREPAQAVQHVDDKIQTTRPKDDPNIRAVLSEARMLSDRMTAALSRIQQVIDSTNSGQQDLGLKGVDAPERGGSKRRGKN